MISRNAVNGSNYKILKSIKYLLVIISLLLYACESTPSNKEIVFTDTKDLFEYGAGIRADAKKGFEKRASKGDTIRLAHEKLFEYLPKSLKNCINDGSPVILKNTIYNRVGQHFKYKDHRFLVSVTDFNNEFALFDDDIMIHTKSLPFEGSTEIRKAVKVGPHKGLFLYQQSNIGTWGICNFWVDNRFIIGVDVELPKSKETLDEILALIDFSKMPKLN
ncbi:hypothetical protein [Emticicia sp. C21]|uniref:hypothetical protein n=1 Tax=Emticicia sp. C21 TaxID=2302915 RepID=UPI000E3563F4|nr:hypothetical protein [Emticicia sp. C21]RFS16218.1 hypothetical protein D0T08_11030 [Emticicia sp. C21]